jgi:hypothetical protein
MQISKKTHHITVTRFYSAPARKLIHSLTHSLIPNLKKDSKETQPTQHSANSQCQSPTSRNDTYQPSQHTIYPCHAQGSGRPDMSQAAGPQSCHALLALAPNVGCACGIRDKAVTERRARFARREWIRLCSGRQITSHKHYKLRIMAPGGGSQRERWPAS